MSQRYVAVQWENEESIKRLEVQVNDYLKQGYFVKNLNIPQIEGKWPVFSILLEKVEE